MHKIFQCSCRIAGMTLALLWLFQAYAVAGIYKWQDDQGKLYFTDDRSKIPQQYRDQLQKFKGITELKPKEEAPAGEEPQEPGPDPQAEAQQPPAQKEPPSAPLLTPEEKAAMTAVYKPLMNVWKDHVKLLMDGEAVDKKLKQYVRVSQSSATNKKAIAKTIGKSEHPFLVEIKSFLKKSARKDVRLREDSNALMTRAENYKKRLMKEIPIEKEFVDELGKKLELKTPPLPTLEEEMAKVAERREQIKKNRQQTSPEKSSDFSPPSELVKRPSGP